MCKPGEFDDICFYCGAIEDEDEICDCNHDEFDNDEYDWMCDE